MYRHVVKIYNYSLKKMKKLLKSTKTYTKLTFQASSFAWLKAKRSLSCILGAKASNSACLAANNLWSRLYFIIFVGPWLLRLSMTLACRLFLLSGCSVFRDMRLAIEALREDVWRLTVFSIKFGISGRSPGSVKALQTALRTSSDRSGPWSPVAHDFSLLRWAHLAARRRSCAALARTQSLKWWPISRDAWLASSMDCKVSPRQDKTCEPAAIASASVFLEALRGFLEAVPLSTKPADRPNLGGRDWALRRGVEMVEPSHNQSKSMAAFLQPKSGEAAWKTSQIIVKRTKMAVREKELSERLNLKITNDWHGDRHGDIIVTWKDLKKKWNVKPSVALGPQHS